MEANPKTNMLILLANILLLLSAIPTILLVLEPVRRNPEGALGFHLITVPLALLQVIALALAIHGKTFDFLPIGRPLAYGMLLPYFIGMNVLPFIALERGFTGPLSRAAIVLILAAAFASVNRFPGASISAAFLSIACLCGIVLIGGEFLPYFRGYAHLFTARGSMSTAEKSALESEADAFAKLPANPALYQLIGFTHAANKEVQRQSLAKIAALPNLEKELIKILGTPWADLTLRYLADHYSGPVAPLAPAYSEFLQKEFAGRAPQLVTNPHAGKWAYSLNRHFDVAERIVKDGGDLRSPLERWRNVFAEAQGTAKQKDRIEALLRPSNSTHTPTQNRIP